MLDGIKVFTYWETSRYADMIPPYILCGFVSMERAFGDRFLLVTKKNLAKSVDFNFENKKFYFAAQQDPKKDEISRIVAKSDFLRFKYIEANGGVWLDSDSIVLSDFFPQISHLFQDDILVWHSEQFFGSLANNSIINKVVENMISWERQLYGNPGGCKELLQENKKDKVAFVPSEVWDPTGALKYNASCWDLTTKKDIPLDSFLINQNCSLVKIYNSTISQTDLSTLSVEEFLKSETLMAKIFLHVESDIAYWVDGAKKYEDSLK